MILFLLVGIFFLKKEFEWSLLERASEIWNLNTDLIEYVKANKPDLSSEELREEVKKIMESLQLPVEEELLQLLTSIGGNKKAVS